LDRQFLQKLVKEENSCAMELLGHVARDMTALQERMTGIQSRSVRERVEYLLNELGNRFGIPSADGIRLNVQLSRDEMASMLGMATETSMLKEENFLKQDGKTIILLNKKNHQIHA
jgi:CRP-like cAMP-binding protein